MTIPIYNRPGMILKKADHDGGIPLVRDLQRDLRRLGYLSKGIDGRFEMATELAVKALQHDLLYNTGKSGANDGLAPVRITDYRKDRMITITGIVDEPLAGCISDMIDDPRFPLLPAAKNPEEENSLIVAEIGNMFSLAVPTPYLMAMFKQESGLRHFNEPAGNDEDAYIVVGLDRNGEQPYVITSRGYGVGQYTLFHHPPKQKEVADFMLDVGKNIRRGALELREKFDHFVNGLTSATRADDRLAETGAVPLRLCVHPPDDQRFMKDCKNCLINAGQKDIHEGDQVYEGSDILFVPTVYYRRASYEAAPIRKNIPCDWPYASRRYNGSGVNSYHYQTRILLNILDL